MGIYDNDIRIVYVLWKYIDGFLHAKIIGGISFQIKFYGVVEQQVKNLRLFCLLKILGVVSLKVKILEMI